jgi:hypothetical protein
MIKILAIGNSFSQDATTYLYDIAKADNLEIKVVNLYIGGCSLKTHWSNIESDAANYDYELNGHNTGRKISIKEALQEEAWDYVTLQQVSSESGLLDTFYPYITKVSDYVKEFVPQAKQLIHQTWAYEIDSDHSAFVNYDCDQMKMYDALTNAYQKAAEELSLSIIPCGTVIQTLRKAPLFDYANGGNSLCRDGFHMSLDYGRYATGATWYEFILKKDILNNSFVPPAVDGKHVGSEEIKLIKDTIHEVISKL